MIFTILDQAANVETCMELIEKMSDIPSAGYQIIIAIIPIVGITFGGAVLFFIFLWNHRQKMAIIEKGLYKRSRFNMVLFSLFSGIILTSVGLALTLYFFLMSGGRSYAMLGGLIPLFLGIGMIVFYRIAKKEVEKHTLIAELPKEERDASLG